uniref:Uncharacterized protein n=1 Tax=Rhizophora mucronata TaxID=61149 RepID=A0A2P2IYU0_RHIMU
MDMENYGGHWLFSDHFLMAGNAIKSTCHIGQHLSNTSISLLLSELLCCVSAPSGMFLYDALSWTAVYSVLNGFLCFPPF